MCGISDYIDLLREGLTNLGIETFHYPVNDLSDISKETNTLPNADIYSLQFAPFAFSTKFFFTNNLRPLQLLLENKNVHVNFHEIWIGTSSSASFLEKFRGWIKKMKYAGLPIH